MTTVTSPMTISSVRAKKSNVRITFVGGDHDAARIWRHIETPDDCVIIGRHDVKRGAVATRRRLDDSTIATGWPGSSLSTVTDSAETVDSFVCDVRHMCGNWGTRGARCSPQVTSRLDVVVVVIWFVAAAASAVSSTRLWNYPPTILRRTCVPRSRRRKPH